MSQIPGLYVPTTDVFGGMSPEEISGNPVEMKNFLTRLRQNMNVLSIAMNLKDTGYYLTTEMLNGQLFFKNPDLDYTTSQFPTYRNVFRKVIDFGALTDTSTKDVAHGITITDDTTFTRIYGTSSDPNTSFIPIPYASATSADIVELEVDATNVSITTGADRTGFTKTYVVLEWIVN